MITSLIEIFTSSGAGAALGLLGSWLTKREERLNLKMKLDNQIALADIHKEEALLEFHHELEMADKTHRAALSEAQMAKEITELGGFLESQKQAQSNYGIRFVDAIRGLMRPLITLYLLLIATLLVTRIEGLSGGLEALAPDALGQLLQDTIGQILFLTTTAVTWWFGSRPAGQRPL